MLCSCWSEDYGIFRSSCELDVRSQGAGDVSFPAVVRTARKAENAGSTRSVRVLSLLYYREETDSLDANSPRLQAQMQQIYPPWLPVVLFTGCTKQRSYAK